MSEDDKNTLFFATVGVVLCVMGVVIFLSLIFAGSGGNFSGRCTEAGYKGAELEMCIKRVEEGLPVYKENIEKWNKGEY